MNWIKRNVLFVASLAVALIIMLAGGFFLFTSIQESATLDEDFNTAISNLQNIHASPAHPGEGRVNNLTIARTNLQTLQTFLAEAKTVFGGANIQTNISDSEFKTTLETTIHQLHQVAREKAVELPEDFSFTFAAQRGKLSFAPGSIPSWLLQLSDIRAITEILFNANVNAIENMRRSPVSADDKTGTSELLNATIVTNEAVLSVPYEISFRCFSEEFAAAMQGLVSSSNFFVVKQFSVQPARAEGTQTSATQQPVGAPPTRGQFPPGTRFPAPGTPGSRPTAGGLQPFLSEKPLLVTLLIDSVRLLSTDAPGEGRQPDPE